MKTSIGAIFVFGVLFSGYLNASEFEIIYDEKSPILVLTEIQQKLDSEVVEFGRELCEPKDLCTIWYFTNRDALTRKFESMKAGQTHQSSNCMYAIFHKDTERNLNGLLFYEELINGC